MAHLKRGSFGQMWVCLIEVLALDHDADMCILHDSEKLIYIMETWSKAQNLMALDVYGDYRLVLHCNYSEMKRLLKSNQIDAFKEQEKK